MIVTAKLTREDLMEAISLLMASKGLKGKVVVNLEDVVIYWNSAGGKLHSLGGEDLEYATVDIEHMAL